MPTYEYECLACEAQFERFQSMSARPVSVCPECGKRRVRRKIGGGAGILFKGSGFYSTDYRTSDYSDRAAAESTKDTKDTKDTNRDTKGTKDSTKSKTDTKGTTDSAKSSGETGKKKTA